MGHRLLPHSPALYHGTDASRPYFEGWFFKHSSEEGSLAVIPGVFRGEKSKDDIAFIQVLLSNPVQSFFTRYPISSFQSKKNRFEIKIGENRFSLDRVKLSVKDIGLEADLAYKDIVPLSTSFFSPSVMGPFSYLRSMQCNHGVLSLRHVVRGYICCGGRRLEFNDDDGYIEKDWGEAFPESWIWMQCGDKESAFMCSIAHIPYGVIRFTGIICVLLAGGKQHRFATYNGGRLKSLIIKSGKVTAEIKRRNMLLEVSADNKEFGSLKAPTKTGMDRVISESLEARYHIKLTDNGKEIFSGAYNCGGLEISGAENLTVKKK